MSCFKRIVFTCSAILLSVFVMAQNETSHQIEINIPEVALLGIVSEKATDIVFSPFSGLQAGSTIVMQTENENNSMWLNYTSVKKGNTHARKVVAVIQGKTLAGLNLMVTPKSNSGQFENEIGVAGETSLLSHRPSEIISGIGSCYTGKGVNKGYNLVYKLEIDESELDFEALEEQVFTFNVLYTLTD